LISGKNRKRKSGIFKGTTRHWLKSFSSYLSARDNDLSLDHRLLLSISEICQVSVIGLPRRGEKRKKVGREGYFRTNSNATYNENEQSKKRKRKVSILTLSTFSL